MASALLDDIPQYICIRHNSLDAVLSAVGATCFHKYLGMWRRLSVLLGCLASKRQVNFCTSYKTSSYPVRETKTSLSGNSENFLWMLLSVLFQFRVFAEMNCHRILSCIDDQIKRLQKHLYPPNSSHSYSVNARYCSSFSSASFDRKGTTRLSSLIRISLLILCSWPSSRMITKF